MNKVGIIKELNRELVMRIRVWKNTRIGGNIEFHNADHQEQYSALLQAYEIIKEMTEKELSIIKHRLEQAKVEQPTLF